MPANVQTYTGAYGSDHPRRTAGELSHRRTWLEDPPKDVLKPGSMRIRDDRQYQAREAIQMDAASRKR